jgi:hypothetical protein
MSTMAKSTCFDVATTRKRVAQEEHKSWVKNLFTEIACDTKINTSLLQPDAL